LNNSLWNATKNIPVLLPGHHEVVELLLDQDSHVDHQTKTGCTPLMEATR
jgi:hypothetical protein